MSSKPEVSTAADVTPDRAKRKLGRGLGALLGETHREESVAPSEGGTALSSAAGQGEGGAGAPRSGLASIPVARIEPLPGQPRQIFDDDALDDLARSIAQRGVIQPVIVRPLERKGRYQLVAGELGPGLGHPVLDEGGERRRRGQVLQVDLGRPGRALNDVHQQPVAVIRQQ